MGEGLGGGTTMEAVFSPERLEQPPRAKIAAAMNGETLPKNREERATLIMGNHMPGDYAEMSRRYEKQPMSESNDYTANRKNRIF